MMLNEQMNVLYNIQKINHFIDPRTIDNVQSILCSVHFLHLPYL